MSPNDEVIVSPNQPVAEQKSALRQRVLAEREALSIEERDRQAALVHARLFIEASFERAKTVLITASFGSEIDTTPVVTALHMARKTVVMPRVVKGEPRLQLKRVTENTQFVLGVFGILEPPASASKVDVNALDLIIVPGVAFDRRGNRLGYGGGYFDRLVTEIEAPLRPEASRCEKIALAFDCQIVDVVPTAPHDRCVPLILTPAERLACTFHGGALDSG